MVSPPNNLTFPILIQTTINKLAHTKNNRVDLHKDYIEYQLHKAKLLCEKHNSKLLLSSYYHGNDKYIEGFAKQSGILYFNLSYDFFKIASKMDRDKYVSRDESHLNPYGYKIYTELLYKKMYLHRRDLNFRLKPLKKRIDEDSFRKKSPMSYLRYMLGKSIFY